MAHIIKHVYHFKRGLAEKWKELNLILDEGEPGFEIDTGKLKIGDGKTNWNNLPYITDVDEIVFDEELKNALDAIKQEIINSFPKIEIDMELSNSSTNPIQNAVVTNKFSEIEQDTKIFQEQATAKFAETEQIVLEIDDKAELLKNQFNNLDTTFNNFQDNTKKQLREQSNIIQNNITAVNNELSLIKETDNNLSSQMTQIHDEIFVLNNTSSKNKQDINFLINSANFKNCLKYYDPNKIKMEYTNKAGGWKASIKDKNTGEEIHGASLFSRHQVEGWDEHSVEFINEGTTDATFQIYSVSKEPGVIQVDDVKIEDLSRNGLYYDPQRSPHDFSNDSGIWTWPATWACTPVNNQAVISITKPTWSGYVNGNLTLTPGGTYYVDINITSYTSGGTNFSIKDSAGAKINLLDLNGKKRTGRYLSAAGTTRLYFIAPNDGQITLYFGGSGDQIDNLTIGSCTVYQSNSTRWSSTSPMLDNAWTQPEDWYTWGKEVDYEGQHVMRFNTSEEKQYWYTKQRTLSLDLDTHYQLSFIAKCMSGGLNIHVKDSNNKTIVRQTISTETAPEWMKFDFSFVPTTENCTLQIQALGDQSLLYNVYVSNLVLTPLIPDQSILCNDGFDNDKYVGGTHYIGRANWTLGSASSIVSGTAQLSVPSGNSLTYVQGCSQDITLIPGNRYRVSFKSKSISHNPMWMPYITFTDEDKVAFVSDIQDMGYEELRLGGPWVNSAAEHYAARVTIKGWAPINAKYLYFFGTIYSSNEFEVDVKIKNSNEEVFYAQQYILAGTSIVGGPKKYYLELPKDFEFHNAHTIELTFMVNEVQETGFINSIYGIGIVGNHELFNYEPQPDYRIDPNHRIYIEELRANHVVTNIDDGSLDWEV